MDALWDNIHSAQATRFSKSSVEKMRSAGQEVWSCQEEKARLWSNEDSRQTRLCQSFGFVEILKLITSRWQEAMFAVHDC